MMYQQKSNPLAYLKILLPLCLIISMAFVITSQDEKVDRELVLECLKKAPENQPYIKHNNDIIGTKYPAAMPSHYFELYADNEILKPEVDYYHFPKLGQAVIINPKLNKLEGPSIYDPEISKDQYFHNENIDLILNVDTIQILDNGTTILNNEPISLDDLEKYLDHIDQQDFSKYRRIVKPQKTNTKSYPAIQLIRKYGNGLSVNTALGNMQFPHQASSTNGSANKVYTINIDQNGIHSIDFSNYSVSQLKDWFKQKDIRSINIKFESKVSNETMNEVLNWTYEQNIACNLNEIESNEFNIRFLPNYKVSVDNEIFELEIFKTWLDSHNEDPSNVYNFSFDKTLSADEIQSISALIKIPSNLKTPSINFPHKLKSNNLSVCLTECKNDIDPFSCSVKTLMLEYSGSQWYTNKLVEKGYEGLLHYSLLIDEKGNLVNVIDENVNPELKLEIESIGNRIAEDINKHYKFSAAKNEGNSTKGNIPLLVNLKLSTAQKERVRTENSKTKPDNQINCYINYITDQGHLAYIIKSEWNVPAQVQITDPTGEIIEETTIDYFYKQDGQQFFIPSKINGVYKIKVTQDGQTVETEFLCEVF